MNNVWSTVTVLVPRSLWCSLKYASTCGEFRGFLGAGSKDSLVAKFACENTERGTITRSAGIVLGEKMEYYLSKLQDTAALKERRENLQGREMMRVVHQRSRDQREKTAVGQ